jgi:hypothetical protein
MFSAILAAALLMAQSTPAAAAAASDPASPPAVAATGATTPVKVKRSDDVICHSEEVLGTRFPKKVCYTRAEQEDRAQQDHDNLNRMQSGFGKSAN